LTLADLWRHHAGIRAQVVRRDGTLVDDFLILNGPGLTAVLNAPSPAATSALPIAAHICDAVL
jgi:L-2-hydroxyglutarate oxidase